MTLLAFHAVCALAFVLALELSGREAREQLAKGDADGGGS